MIPIPPPDPLGLPGAAWLFYLLIVVTFVSHMVVMNLAFGGTMILMGLDAHALVRRRPPHPIGNPLLQTMPVAISFTITTGVAPLLFVQVLYGQYFYPANVFLGLTWFSFVVFLLIGFYAAYVAVARGSNRLLDRTGAWDARPGRRLIFVGAAVLCFLVLGWILTNNHVMSIMPEHWVRDGQWRRNVLYAGDRAVIPRRLHFVLGPLAAGGLWVAGIGWWRRRRGLDGEASTESAIRLGLWIAAVAGGLNVVAGAAFLFHHPLAVVREVFDVGRPETWVFLLTLAALIPAHGVTLVLALKRPLEFRWFAWTAAALLGIIAGMAVTREHIRLIHLARDSAGRFSLTSWEPVEWQLGPLVVFLITFVLGLATVGTMLRWMLAGPPHRPPAGDGART